MVNPMLVNLFSIIPSFEHKNDYSIASCYGRPFLPLKVQLLCPWEPRLSEGERLRLVNCWHGSTFSGRRKSETSFRPCYSDSVRISRRMIYRRIYRCHCSTVTVNCRDCHLVEFSRIGCPLLVVCLFNSKQTEYKIYKIYI